MKMDNQSFAETHSNEVEREVPSAAKMIEAARLIEDVGYALAPTGKSSVVSVLMIAANEIEKLAKTIKSVETAS